MLLVSSGRTERRSVAVRLQSCCLSDESLMQPSCAAAVSRCMTLAHALWSMVMCSAAVAASTALHQYAELCLVHCRLRKHHLSTPACGVDCQLLFRHHV